MSTETRQEFGRRVRTLRESKGFSLRQFALTIGINKSFLVEIEYGRKAPTLDTMEKIAWGLGVPISYLLFGVGPIKDGAMPDAAPCAKRGAEEQRR